MGGRAYRAVCGAFAVLAIVLPPAAVAAATAGGHGRASFQESSDNDIQNNDDFSTAQQITSMERGDFLAGTTGLQDGHRFDTFVMKNVPSGKVVNASVRITNWNGNDRQALLMTGWNSARTDNLAWSNREDNPDRREWEAVTFLCVVSGDYYVQLRPIAGTGTFRYELNVRVFDPPDITGLIGSGGVFGPQIIGNVSSCKWYPGAWYRFQLAGERAGLIDYLYANLTLPGGPEERLQGDMYVRSLEKEGWSFWLNQSWWLCSHVQNEEVRAAACRPGPAWYYLDVQAYNTTGQRSENYELRLSKTAIDSDGDNHPLNATKVTYEHGKSTITKQGCVRRGPDMFDWYKVYLKQGNGVGANLTLQEKSAAVFRLSIYRDNLTSHYAEKGYDIMSSWTNKPADAVLNRANALVTNVSQEGWYYIAVIAQIGLDPENSSNLADWTVCTPWANYRLDLTLACGSSHTPMVRNPPASIIMPEDGEYGPLELNWTGNNSGVFWDEDFKEDWGDELRFSFVPDPNFTITTDNSRQDAPMTIRPRRDWNGEASITLTATDLFGRANTTFASVRVAPVEDPPYVKARIPDFIVRENDCNMTMMDIDLFEVFGDPDFPPYGEDNLTFGVDNSTYPAVIDGSMLSFGQAPGLPRKMSNRVTVRVSAADRSGSSATLDVNITIIGCPPPPPEFWGGLIEILEDETSIIDLNRYFIDPDGSPLAFAYLGGATNNLTVEMAPNGTAVLKPARNYFTPQEILRFRAIDPRGPNMSGELLVRIRNVNDPPYFLPCSIRPDPLEIPLLAEGGEMAFHAAAADIDNKSPELKYTWSVDGVEKTALGGNSFTWRPGYEDAGEHIVSLAVSDGLAGIGAKWNITVLDTNRPPVVVRAWPMNNTEAGWDRSIRFGAEAFDPDGGPLTFTWRLSDGRIIHQDFSVNISTFSRRLPSGRMNMVLLDVEDSGGMVTRETIYINVGARGNGIEDSWTMIWECMLAALAAALLAQYFRGRHGRGGRHP